MIAACPTFGLFVFVFVTFGLFVFITIWLHTQKTWPFSPTVMVFLYMERMTCPPPNVAWMVINFLNFDDKMTEMKFFGGHTGNTVGPVCNRNHITNVVVNVGSDIYLDSQIRAVVKSIEAIG